MESGGVHQTQQHFLAILAQTWVSLVQSTRVQLDYVDKGKVLLNPWMKITSMLMCSTEMTRLQPYTVTVKICVKSLRQVIWNLSTIWPDNYHPDIMEFAHIIQTHSTRAYNTTRNFYHCPLCECFSTSLAHSGFPITLTLPDCTGQSSCNSLLAYRTELMI